MKFTRFRTRDGKEHYGIVEGDDLRICAGEPFAGLAPTGPIVNMADVRLLPPCRPTKMIAIWRNSHALLRERREQPTQDLLWVTKPPSCFAATGDPILLPPGAGRVIFEGELGLVVGRRCSRIVVDRAGDYIAGWTVVNEVTAIDIAKRDPVFQQHGRAKSYDTFGVFGPVIETALDLSRAVIRTWQNGRLMQEFGVADMVRSPHRILAELSWDMTLEPGDVVACGSTVGVAPMAPGDTIRIAIDGIGSIENPVA